MAGQKKTVGIIAMLREAITASGLSLSEIAKQADISHSQLSRFMREERGLTLAAAAEVCLVLGLRLVKAEGGEEVAGAPPAAEAAPPGNRPPKKKGRGGRA